MNPINQLLNFYEYISDMRVLTPSSKLMQINPLNDLGKKYDRQTLEYLFELLENDHKVITVHTRPDYQNEYHYRFSVNDNFDEAYNRLYKQVNSGVSNLQYPAILRVYEVALDINDQLQLTSEDTIKVIISPLSNRFRKELSHDTIPVYQSGYESGLKFLQEQDAIGAFVAHYELDRTYRARVDNINRPRFYRLLNWLYVRYGELEKTQTQAFINQTREMLKKYNDEQPTASNDATQKQAVETSETNAQKSIKIHQLHPQHYSARTGVLWLSPTDNVVVAKKGKVKRPSGKKYEECWLLECLFKNVNSLKRGVKISSIYRLHPVKIDERMVNKVRNYIFEIDKKIVEKGGPKRLIFVQDKTVKIDKSYL